MGHKTATAITCTATTNVHPRRLPQPSSCKRLWIEKTTVIIALVTTTNRYQRTGSLGIEAYRSPGFVDVSAVAASSAGQDTERTSKWIIPLVPTKALPLIATTSPTVIS